MIATEAIKTGKVVVCPTDTVYGLIADATNRDAVQRTFRIKKRLKKNALPIFVKNLKMAKDLAEINKKQERILKKIWPGKVTVILKKKSRIKIFGADKKTIGLRIPNYKLVNILLEKLNRPLIGTSANISGKPASTRIKEVLKQFKNPAPKGRGSLNKVEWQKIKPDLVLDAGNLPKRKPSKVIDLTGKNVKILRP